MKNVDRMRNGQGAVRPILKTKKKTEGKGEDMGWGALLIPYINGRSNDNVEGIQTQTEKKTRA